MIYINLQRLLLGAVFIFYSSCSVNWTRAIQYGEVDRQNFDETVDIHIQEGLIFVAVTIGGEEYKFLFDTGAPLSISHQLQKKYSYKVISKGNIVDSDQNRKQVSWVQIDSVEIGDVAFLNQSAFVGDFSANPTLECLNIDGIIGSNLMRQCNWTIDQDGRQLRLSDTIDPSTEERSITLPFVTDNQYNMFVNIGIGTSTVRNLLVDYGSNGSIAVNDEIFSKLKERKTFGEIYLEEGVKQSGIVGKPIALNRKITWLDSISVHDQPLYNVVLRTGKKDLVGNKILSRFLVTIDWTTKSLHLMTRRPINAEEGSFGFRIGFTKAKGVYIQSVIESSDAHKKGVRPDMLVAKVDALDFESGDDLCDFMRLDSDDSISLELIDSNGQRQTYIIERTRFMHE